MNVMSYVRLADVSNGDTVRIRKGFRKGRLIVLDFLPIRRR